MSDRDRKSIFEECYKQAEAAWRPAWAEMKKDLRFYEGDQLSAEEKQYLALHRRQKYVMNAIKKMARLLTGYERKTRLSMVVGPEGGEQDMACEQHTKVLMHTLNRNAGQAYQVMSDAFKFGTLITGQNLVTFWPDRNGDISFGRRPYNKFLLDPSFTSLNLDDCQYAILGDAVTKEQAKRLVGSERAGRIDRAFLAGSGTGDFGLSKWPFMTKKFTPYKDDLRRYEEFWRRTTRTKRFIINKQTMQLTDWEQFTKQVSDEDREQLTRLIAMNPARYSMIEDDADAIELDIYYNGILIETIKDPYGLNDYSFVLMAGDFQPEEEDAEYKLSGLIRTARDPQRADNRRMMQMLDMAESQITTGWLAKTSKVTNPEALYQTGQGAVVDVKDEADIATDFMKLNAGEIPASYFSLEQLAASKVMSLMGISDETFGAGEKDIPMGLWAMRQGAALTVFQEPFDNYRAARKQLGRKVVRLHQANFSPQKIQRITGQPIAPGFFSPDFEKYDCTLIEGVLTDTQRQMAYAEMIQLKQAEAPIPWDVILELAPIQLKSKLKQSIAMAAKQQEQAGQAEMQRQQTEMALNITKAEQQKAGAEKGRADAGLSRVEAVVKLQQAQLDRIVNVADRLIEIENLNDRRFRKEAIVRR